MIEVIASIDVHASPEQVARYWFEWTNNPEWQLGMDACTWTSEPPLAVGSTYDQHARMMGRPIVSCFEVTEHDPGRKLRIQTTVSTLPLDITREVVPRSGGGSQLTATIRGEPAGLMRLMNPLTRRMVRRNVTADYERLRAKLNG